MVFVNLPSALNLSTLRQQVDSLRQSVDLNVRDLLQRGDMPLPLAVYLWDIQRHHMALVNADVLAQWGIAWVRQILIEQRWGVRKDEDIASAALAAVALKESPAVAKMHDAIRLNLEQTLASESQRARIPFRRPVYAVFLLLAAKAFQVNESRITASLQATAQAFIQGVSTGRLFGAGFLVELLHACGDSARNEELVAALFQVIAHLGSQYEDRVYAIQALWVASQHEVMSQQSAALIAEMAEEEVKKTPGWAYVMTGDETIQATGDVSDRVPLSPLYRSILLDLTVNVERRATITAEARLDRRYRGDRIVVFSAYGLWAAGFVVIPAIMLVVVLTHLKLVFQYFILHEFGVMSVTFALLNILTLAALGYFAPLAFVALPRLWQLMVTRKVQSDQRALEIIRDSARAILKPWLYVVGGVIGLGILGSFFYPAFAHIAGAR